MLYGLLACLLSGLYAHSALAQTVRIEAEDYINAYDTTAGTQYGAAVTACTYGAMNVDVRDSPDGPGCVVGWTATGEWLEYSINLPASGSYQLAYRYSSPNNGSAGQIVFKSNGSTRTITDLTEGSGAWSDLRIQYTSVNLSAGVQTIRLEFNSPVFDLDWFQLEYLEQPIPASSLRIEYEDYTNAYDSENENRASAPSNCAYRGMGVDVTNTSDAGGGCKVGYVREGEWLEYEVNPDFAGQYRFTMRYASGRDGTPAGTLSLKRNGVALESAELLGTGSFESFAESTFVAGLTAGIQTLRWEFVAPNFDLNWFDLELKTVYITDDSTYRIEAEDYNNAFDTNSNNAATDAGSTLTNCDYHFLGVDVADLGATGCTIGYIADGEWLEYSIYVAEASDYTLTYRYASGTGGPGTGGNILFKVDGTTAKTTTISPVTGSWDTYAETTDTVALAAGLHTIRIEFSNPYLNLDWFSLQKTAPSDDDGGVGSCHFPAAVASASDAGSVDIQGGGLLTGSPDNQVVTKNLTAAANSCGSGVTCTKTNTTAEPFNDVPAIPGGANISVNYQGSRNLSPGDYGSLFVNSEASLNLSPGVYTFNGNFQVNSSSAVTITSAGHVEIYVKGNFDTGANSFFNAPADGSKTAFVYASGTINLQFATQASMVAYAAGAATLNTDVTLYGALTSEAKITVPFGGEVVFDEDVINASGSCAVEPGLLEVNVAASASTCAPQAVSIAVKNTLDEVMTDYTGTVTLSTSTGHGDWRKTGNASDAYGTLSAGASDSGSATYTFSESDNGAITLALVNGRTESLTISAVGSIAGELGTSAAVTFSTNGYVATDVTGGRHVVGYPQQWRVQMMQQDPVTGDCAVNAGYSQAGVKAWLVRTASDPNGAAPTLIDSESGNSVAVPNSEPASNNFNLTFVNGEANFTVNTTDVGSYTFYLADKTRSFADVDLVMESGLNSYGPFGYYVSVVSNPAATSAAGAAFQAAGEPFRVNVAAVAWQAEDDLNDDKIPDGHDSPGEGSRANLANNAVIASFGQETPAESITLSSTLLLPAGGADPGLEDGDTSAALARTVNNFSGGSGFIERVYFDEVGIIELQAQVSDGEYLSQSAGHTLQSQSYSNNVGRFSAARFEFSGGTLTEACQTGLDFSYMGQGFTGEFSIIPKSSRDTSLQNYTGDFAKLGLGDFEFFARDSNAGVDLSGRLAGTATALAWAGGEGSVAVELTVNRANAPDGPYTTLSVATDFDDSDGAALAAASKDLDSDGDASNDSAVIGDTEVRFGRVSLGNAHGPETAKLAVPLRIEYWSSPSWLINIDDSCTTLERSAIAYPSGAIATAANREVALGGGTTTGSYSTILGDAVLFTEGRAGHEFSAPGAGNTGSFQTFIDLSSYPWLRFDWNGDGDYADGAVPPNQVNFGVYRGHDRMLYWLEY
ncbi:MAG TPA: DUF6701 domain-containing protein [Marinagarivorans sp.]